MENNELFIIYNNDGIFFGFYDDLNVVNTILQANDSLHYNAITQEIRDHLLTLSSKLINYPVINLTKVTTDTVIDSTDYLLDISQQKSTVDINKIAESLVVTIKYECGEYIKNGVYLAVGDSEPKQYKYELEDQMNLLNIIKNYEETDIVYYHPSGESDIEYAYDDIVVIYKALENNKTYNLIYTDVLCKWIKENYSEEMSQDKNTIITYGYINDEILEEVEERYAKQILL